MGLLRKCPICGRIYRGKCPFCSKLFDAVGRLSAVLDELGFKEIKSEISGEEVKIYARR